MTLRNETGDTIAAEPVHGTDRCPHRQAMRVIRSVGARLDRPRAPGLRTAGNGLAAVAS